MDSPPFSEQLWTQYSVRDEKKEDLIRDWRGYSTAPSMGQENNCKGDNKCRQGCLVVGAEEFELQEDKDCHQDVVADPRARHHSGEQN
jgi:hypothetical protein